MFVAADLESADACPADSKSAATKNAMKLHPLHSWNLTPAEAVALQRQLAAQIDTRTPLRHADLIAGADVAYNRYSDTVHAGVVVLRAADWSIVEQQSF